MNMLYRQLAFSAFCQVLPVAAASFLSFLCGPASAFVVSPSNQHCKGWWLLALAGTDSDVDVIRQAALDRSVPSFRLIPILESLEQQQPQESVQPSLIDGTFELVFSSAVAQLPLVGGWLDGYLPNREIIVFDLQEGQLRLSVETLPFVPAIDIVGENLVFNQEKSCLQYTVKGKSKTSTWNIVLYADADVLAAKSSVTGLNIIRRV